MIYKMKLHETRRIGVHTRIMRVPGGWIYKIIGGYPNLAVFVPYNAEFEDREISLEDKASEYDFPALEYQSEGG